MTVSAAAAQVFAFNTVKHVTFVPTPAIIHNKPLPKIIQSIP